MDMYEELLRELGNLIAIRELMVVAGKEMKPKVVDIAGSALIFHLFVIEQISASKTGLIGIIKDISDTRQELKIHTWIFYKT